MIQFPKIKIKIIVKNNINRIIYYYIMEPILSSMYFISIILVSYIITSDICIQEQNSRTLSQVANRLSNIETLLT
jgi:hypothetical protein